MSSLNSLWKKVRYHMIMMFVWLLGVYCPTREFVTHLELPPLPVKDCKFRPKFVTRGHWAVRVLERATPTVTWGIGSYGHPRGTGTFTLVAVFGSGAVATCLMTLVCHGWGSNNQPSACEASALIDCNTYRYDHRHKSRFSDLTYSMYGN